jgi:hypothetical protein
MITTLIDENTVGAGLACLNTDTVQGTNLVRIKINASNRGMQVDQLSTISFTMVPIDPRDENYRTCKTFTGSDGLVYPWVANSDGHVLIAT